MIVVRWIAPLAVALAVDAAAAPAVPPPAAPAPKAEILGVWKGSSTCTKAEGTEYCRDETVVYNVLDVPDQPDTVSLKAARVANEIVRPMYELFFTYRRDTATWSSEFTRPKFRGVWTYAVHGDEMTGTAAMLPDKRVVRNVVVKRVPQEAVRQPGP